MKNSLLFFMFLFTCVSGITCTVTAKKLNQQALLALNNENYDEAIALLKKAVVLQPDNPRTHLLLGMSYKAKGDLPEAITEYNKALNIKPDDPFTLCLLADVYLTQGRVDETITLSKKVLAIDPESALGHYHLGIAYRKQNKMTTAAHYLYKAGVLAFLDSEPKLAIKSYRALEEIGPTKPTHDLYELLKPLLTDYATIKNLSS